MKRRGSIALPVPECSSTAPTTTHRIEHRPLQPTTTEAPRPALAAASSDIAKPALPFTAWSTPENEIRSFFRSNKFGIKAYQEHPGSVSDMTNYHCVIHAGYFQRALIDRDWDFVSRLGKRLNMVGRTLSSTDLHVQPQKLCEFYPAETRNEIRRFCRDNGLLHLRFMFMGREGDLTEVGVVMRKTFYEQVVWQIGYRKWLEGFGSSLADGETYPEFRALFLALEETVSREELSEELRQTCTALAVDVWMGTLVENEDD